MCDSTGSGLSDICVWISSGLLPCPFPDFVLHPFVIINQNCEFDYMVGSVNHPSNSSNLGMFIGTPNVGV